MDYTFEAALANHPDLSRMMMPPRRGTYQRGRPRQQDALKKSQLAQIGYRLYATEGTAA